MKIYFATDHAGFDMKNDVRLYVQQLGYNTEDCGAFSLDENDDYPIFVKKASEKVSERPEDSKAIIFGGSGQGEMIVANKFPNVRAVEYYEPNLDIITLSRSHNDANILSIGARFITLDEAKQAVKLWLETPFSGEERHKRRIEEIEN